MSYSGLDASYYKHSGIPSQQERLNLDFELGALEQKAMAGVVKGEDTLDLAIQYGQSFGRHPTNSSRPTLPSPMWNLRVSAAEIQLPPEVWGPAFESLLQLLPEETKQKLIDDMGKTYTERSPDFIALQGLLETAAKYVTTLELANLDLDPASPAALKREDFLALPGTSLGNLESIAVDVLKEAERLLKEE